MDRKTALGSASAALAALLTLAGASPAQAQDAPEKPASRPGGPSGVPEAEKLRIENEELRRRVVALERELTNAKNTIASLRKTRDPEKPSAPTTIELPDDPLACPSSLIADLKKRYQAEFGSLQDPKDDATLRLKSQRWARDAEKLSRGKANWLVRFQRIEQIGQGSGAVSRALTVVLDPTTQLPLGESFSMDIPARFAPKVVGAKPDELWQLSLTASPRLKFNPQRPEAGNPDVPKFIGKYIELETDYLWDGVSESKAEKIKPK